MSYKFTWLDASQRKDFQTRWWHLFRQVEKWRKYARPGEVHDIFCNKKDLLQEITDLEDISLSAYRAMKYLKQFIKDNETGEVETKPPAPIAPQIICACGVNLTYANDFVRGAGDSKYCSIKCWQGAQNKTIKAENICSCGRALTGVKTHYIAVYNRYFCDAQCLAAFEAGYESESYAG